MINAYAPATKLNYVSQNFVMETTTAMKLSASSFHGKVLVFKFDFCQNPVSNFEEFQSLPWHWWIQGASPKHPDSFVFMK